MQELSEKTKSILKKSEHLIWGNLSQLTHRMYEIMFEKYPETKALFKNFRKHQPDVFGAAVMCHLLSIDDPEVLNSFRISICRKHVQACVEEKHYSMMAESLFIAMEEILKDQVTQEIIDAWEKWYYFIANLLIERERDHYQGKRLLFPDDN